MNNAKSKGGRPKTYEGEKNIRVSIAIRPRYRQAIELISKDRNTSLNEVVEFAIAKLASQYEIEGKMVLDYVRPRDEAKKRIQDALAPYPPRYSSKTDSMWSARFLLPADWALSFLQSFDNLPKNLRSSQDIFTADILRKIGEPMFISNLFEHTLINAILEDWKEGRSEHDVIVDIKDVIQNTDEKHIIAAQELADGTINLLKNS